MKRKLIALALTGAALTTGGVFGAAAWVRREAAPRMFSTVEETPGSDVAIVLGASVFASGRPSPIVEDRLEAALALYRAAKVRKLLVSGDHRADHYDEVNAMYAYLVRAGVPAGDVFLDHAGFRTLDTMERAARVFRVHRAVICTQAFHLPRALFLARRAGLQAVGLVADRRVYAARARDGLRERFATVLAVLDSYVLARGPRHLGPPIPIEGDGRATHDHRTPPEHALK